MEKTGPPLLCCFCNGEIPVGPLADRTGEGSRIGFMDFLPGDGFAAFLARTQTFECHAGCFRERLHDPASLHPFEYEEDDREEVREKVLESCGEVAADLVGFARNQPFLDALFASPAGRWIAVEELCGELPAQQRRLAELSERARDEITLMVQHAPHPLDEAGDYSLVVFCEPAYLWSTAVLQRRGG